MRLAYRDPDSWPSLMALERRRTLTGSDHQLSAAAAKAFRLAIAAT
jgi:hypothetical protein